ncbi:MAG TPA: efflux transporter outer membrane subunit [Pseudomonadales bacterium]|jgi:NodT family efflux transporter outer membrane factor (OMF) lipoprotein|nr:efflux transporter outer membrane subunit [Pseudomonadales bacterium]
MSDRAPRRYRWGIPLIAVVVSGCAVGPDFTRPDAPAVDRYDQTQMLLPGAGDGQPQQTLQSGSAPADQWWRAFGSAPLNATVELALRGSPTLEAAQATLSAANETLAATRGALFPQVDLGARTSRGNSGGLTSTGGGSVRNLYDVGGSIGYAVDIFGGTRRRVEQQAALVDFQRGLVGTAYLSLTGDVVTAAIDAASALEELAAAQDIIDVDAHNLQLVQISEAAGKSAGTDVLAAEGQLASDRALLPPLRQQLDVARHQLAVLVGRYPADWSPPEFRFASMTLPTELPLTLPSELVRARPDILAAEAQLHAASAAVGVATAALYPSLTLSSSWTTTSGTSGDLFSANSDVWSIAAGLTAPLFHGGTLRAEQRAAVDTLAATLAQYRQTVLQAFGQVADALNALQHDAEAVEAQQAALESSRASLELTQQSYEAGQASFLQILVTQRIYLQARLGIARAESQRYLDTALLFLVLGGDVLSAPEAR